MYRTQCVLAFIALYAGLADTFSWDIVVSRDNGLEFYNNGTLTHSESYPTSNYSMAWMTYDASHNRVLFSNKTNDGKCTLLYTLDIETGKTEPLIKSNPCRDIDPESFVYDPTTGLLFGATRNPSSVYSFLVKSGSNNEIGDGNLVVDFRYEAKYAQPVEFAVDSCGAYIYWTTNSEINRIERARFNGSDKEIIIDTGKTYKHALTIDSQTQKMYFCENDFYHFLGVEIFIVSVSLDGKNRKTIYKEFIAGYNPPSQLIVSQSFIYWTDDRMFISQLPKNLPNDTNVLPKKFLIDTTSHAIHNITANYKIEEQTRGTPLCKALRSVSSIYSATNDSHILLPANETKASEESRVSGEYGVSICDYYCLNGNCSISADGHIKCRCNAGYSGRRCETKACLSYCLNGGICSLNEKNKPICVCASGYEGDRCEVKACLRYCLNNGACSLNERSEPVCACAPGYEGDRCEVNVVEPESFQNLLTKTISMLKMILNEVPEGKEEIDESDSSESTCNYAMCVEVVSEETAEDRD